MLTDYYEYETYNTYYYTSEAAVTTSASTDYYYTYDYYTSAPGGGGGGGGSGEIGHNDQSGWVGVWHGRLESLQVL